MNMYIQQLHPQDAAPSVICKNNNSMPKLRKNRKIESRWGVKYHTAVRNAVFGTPTLPYRPPEMPVTLQGIYPGSDTLYLCQQCYDCFHFRRSFEEHITRHSWILGFWCTQCFLSACTHMHTEGSSCFDCIRLNRDKRAYLRGKGLLKSHKFGVVRVFYNQCQFLAHLRSHHLNGVDMGDLMLMPMPTNVGNGWCQELDIACEALMENSFISRVHIMEWLKTEKLDSNWWQLATSELNSENPLTKIIKAYRGRFFFKSISNEAEELSALNTSTDTDIRKLAKNADKTKSLITVDTTPSTTSDQNTIELEDNPCTVNDIAFVDCGSASKYLEPESPVHNVSRKLPTIAIKPKSDSSDIFQFGNGKINKTRKVKTVVSKYTSPDMAMAYGNITITAKVESAAVDSTMFPVEAQLRKNGTQECNKGKVPNKIVTESNTTRVDHDAKDTFNTSIHTDTYATKMQIGKAKSDKVKQNAHAMSVNPPSKILTIQSQGNVDVSKLITQLPPHLVNSKRIVFIEQDADGRIIRSTQDSPTKKLVKIGPDTSLEKGMKLSQTEVYDKHTIGELNKDFNQGTLTSQPEPFTRHQPSFPSNVMYQNGRKILLKPSSSILKNVKCIPNIILPTTEVQIVKKAVFDNNIPPLIPINSSEFEGNSTPDKTTAAHSDISPLTPSPSPSELSSSSSCDAQSKQNNKTAIKSLQKLHAQAPQASAESVEAGINTLNADITSESLVFHKGLDENLYLDIKFLNLKPTQTIADTSAMIAKSRQEMLNEFFHLSYSELKKRHEHLQHVNEEISRVLKNILGDKEIKETQKAVNILQHVLQHCIEKCSDRSEDKIATEAPWYEWEAEYQLVKEKPTCTLCNKVIKPSLYIPGFSKPAKDDIYCFCYRHICHKCCTYQGGMTRFFAHRSLHNKEKPYQCPDCYRRFTLYKSLEVHACNICCHAFKRRLFGCRICEIDGFQDMESIARHFGIMHSQSKIACERCYIVLPHYSEYKKHSATVHSEVNDLSPIRLVLCKLGRCIVRYEEYMAHMEKHAVVLKLIWYKCPFCSVVKHDGSQIMVHFQAEHLQSLPELLKSDKPWGALPMEITMNSFKSIRQNTSLSKSLPIKFTNTYEEPCDDGTIVPKIINTRTITSEVFERGTQDGVDDLTTDARNPSSTGLNFTSSKLSKSTNPKLGTPDTTTIPETNKVAALPKILSVRSIASMRASNSTPAIKETVVNSTNEKGSESRSTDDSKDPNEPESNIADPSADTQVPVPKEDLIAKKINSQKPRSGTADKQDLAGDKSSTESFVCSELFSLHNPLLGSTEARAISNASGKASEATIESAGNMCSNKPKTRATTNQDTEKSAKNTIDLFTKQTEDSTMGAERWKQVDGMLVGSIAKPPPLARIPQRFLGFSKPKDSGEESSKREREIATPPLKNLKANRQTPWRFAVSASVASEEQVVNFACHLCGEPVNTSWPVISSHFKMKHSDNYKLSFISPKLLRLSPEFINEGYKEFLDNKKRKYEGVPSISKRRRRWTPKKCSEIKATTSPGLGLYVKQETAEDGEGNFRCKKCNQRCTDMVDLREHIAANHRIKGRYLICLECGENFVVAPSLQMHLKAFHGIEDPITYMTQNTSYAPDSVDDLEIEGKVVEGNQCYVCMAVFEDKAAVDKHLRVHGMAFLNRKRIEARNALKSPEKKMDIEEGNHGSPKESSKEFVRKDNPAETVLEKINATV